MPYTASLTRIYIDTRSFKLQTPSTPLPLLTTLPPETQTSITRFLRAPDRLMSLASALLKHYFIHTTAKLPWSEITISRTPKPHSRPYWAAPDTWTGEWGGGVEFNVSHQAGLTCLIGCKTPTFETGLMPVDLNNLSLNAQAEAGSTPRLGVDVACTHEPGRSPRNIATPAQLASWIDVFAEMFSVRERAEMKLPPTTKATDEGEIDARLRRFYTAWALKEAFIKLVGEGLLAPWLRELEFLGVRPPAPISTRPREEDKWTPPDSAERDFQVLLRGRQIRSDKIDIGVVAFEEDFVVAVATKGIVERDEGCGWVKMDIERDIRPCAEGRCQCLD